MRKQRAFASLTEAEINQVAEWLGPGTYAAVLERLKKPRPEGFDLHISRKPLETLYTNKNRVDQINERIKGDTKLTLGQFYAILGGEPLDLCDEVHEAILETTRDLALSGDNTPTDLLALQRLADFPARAEHREHKVALELRKEAMGLRKETHKVEMDTHRKHMCEERLALAKRSLELREKVAAAKLEASPDQSAMVDDLGPLATDYDGVRRRADTKFRLNDISEPTDDCDTESSSSPISLVHSSPPLALSPGPLALPTTAPTPDDPQEPTPSRDQPSETDTLINTQLQLGESNTENPPAVSTASPSSESSSNSPANSLIREQIGGGVENAMLNESQSLALSPQPLALPSSLEQRVNEYTVARYHEANNGKDPRKVGKWTALKFKSQLQYCPCGNQPPCPDHGDFPAYFWELTPECFEYMECLKQKHLPYTSPFMLIQDKLKQEKREQVFKNFPLNPDDLRRRSTDHAIRRWRSHTNQPPGTPPPNDSWIHECPCGAPHPCNHHEGLWLEVRYVKPSKPEYAAALTRHGIPVYTPTLEDLQPSQLITDN